MFILMVESFGKDETRRGAGRIVVKIGPEAKIKREIAGWNCCRPPGLKHDLVFLHLPRGTPDRDGETG